MSFSAIPISAAITFAIIGIGGFTYSCIPDAGGDPYELTQADFVIGTPYRDGEQETLVNGCKSNPTFRRSGIELEGFCTCVGNTAARTWNRVDRLVFISMFNNQERVLKRLFKDIAARDGNDSAKHEWAMRTARMMEACAQ
jgi:hypothetical protein